MRAGTTVLWMSSRKHESGFAGSCPSRRQSAARGPSQRCALSKKANHATKAERHSFGEKSKASGDSRQMARDGTGARHARSSQRRIPRRPQQSTRRAQAQTRTSHRHASLEKWLMGQPCVVLEARPQRGHHAVHEAFARRRQQCATRRRQVHALQADCDWVSCGRWRWRHGHLCCGPGAASSKRRRGRRRERGKRCRRQLNHADADEQGYAHVCTGVVRR